MCFCAKWLWFRAVGSSKRMPHEMQEEAVSVHVEQYSCKSVNRHTVEQPTRSGAGGHQKRLSSTLSGRHDGEPGCTKDTPDSSRQAPCTSHISRSEPSHRCRRHRRLQASASLSHRCRRHRRLQASARRHWTTSERNRPFPCAHPLSSVRSCCACMSQSRSAPCSMDILDRAAATSPSKVDSITGCRKDTPGCLRRSIDRCHIQAAIRSSM